MFTFTEKYLIDILAILKNMKTSKTAEVWRQLGYGIIPASLVKDRAEDIKTLSCCIPYKFLPYLMNNYLPITIMPILSKYWRKSFTHSYANIWGKD